MTSLTVFYNDSCPVCRQEINHYRRISERHALSIGYVDVSGDDTSCPLDQQAMLKRLHVEDGANRYAGAPAFLRLWAELPGYGWLARLMGLPGIRQGFALVYDYVLAPALYAWHRRRVREGKV